MSLNSFSYKTKKLTMAVLILAIFIAAIGSLSCFTDIAQAEEIQPVAAGGPDIKAESCVVMDINTGAVLFAKNPTNAYQPSSLTKLMTCYLALENLNLTGNITVSADAASISFPTAAEIGYTNGEIITVQDAIKGMLLCSAEDCTYALAERIGGNTTNFNELMNKTADSLGLINTQFVNPLGKYAEGHYSCAYDLAKLAAVLMTDYSAYASILSEKNANLGATNNRNSQTITSTHRFMNDVDTCEHVYAAKTGGSAYGGNGKWALCTYAKYKNMNVVCIILDGPTNDSTYSDTKKLLNYVWESYDTVSSSLLLNDSYQDMGAMFNELEMFSVSEKSTIYVANDALTTLPVHYQKDLITSTVSFNQLTEYQYGENVIGKISFYYNNIFCGTSDIIFYTETVSMTAEEFSKLFPSYLTTPNVNTMNYMTHNTVNSHAKLGFWAKLKAGILSYYTPAKTVSFVVGLVVFIIGALIILLVFPTQKKFKDENLYSSLYDNVPNNEYEGETGNLRRMRTSTDIDMQEIGSTSSFSDNRKKRNHR